MNFSRVAFRMIILLLPVFIFQSCKKGSEKLRDQLQVIKEKPHLEGEPIHNAEIVTGLYEKGDSLPFEKWEKEQIDQMLIAINDISEEGLHPNDYHFNAIQKLRKIIFESDTAEVEDVAKLELLLTDAFVLMAAHLAAGKTDAEKIDPQWKASRRDLNLDYEKLLDSTLQKNNIPKILTNLTPTHQEYKNLKKALAQYKTIEANGGWESFSVSAAKLEKGMAHEDVLKLRKRLRITQSPFEPVEHENFFDKSLHEKIIIFQKHNGLTPDGVVGKGTVEAMNIPVEERIATLEANLERWRWLKDDLGERRIMVNIANFELQIFEQDSLVFSSEAIVGKPYRKTPVFSSKMNYLVLAPTWTIPPTILKQDVIPAVAKNPSYLKQKNMKVLRGDGTEVNPASIDWKNTSGGFPYMIQQAPGKDNALGAVKFMFPNEYSVYIHDTPSRDLFAQTERSFSSGCIRIKKPLELAEYLLQDKPEWTPEQIKKTVEQGKPRNINITKPVPVHILYMTALADKDGNAYFRKDIYDRNARLLKALKQAPPKPE